MLVHLQRAEIDAARWNEAVSSDPGGLPYGLTWWLDAVCPGRWSGLILDDYRVVMPLPLEPFSWRSPWSSWARPRVQRPVFTQQVGPYGEARAGDVAKLLANLPTALFPASFPLTENNFPEQLPGHYAPEFRSNYVLDLSPEPETIRAGYHKDLRRKLRKHGPGHLSFAEPDLILRLYRDQIGGKAGLKTKHFTRARALINTALENDAGYCYQLTGDDNELLATGFFPHHRGRIINLMPASTPAGYRREGMAQLIDAVIGQHRGPGRWLDFEGSDHPGIARFFRYFGPEQRPYLTVR